MKLSNPVLLALAACVWCGILFVSARATPNAFVFGDEAGYFLPIIFGTSPANYQRWGVVLEYPSYLYFWLYAFLPRDNLHLWIKALNAVFIAGTALPVFLIARRIVPVTLAALFACFVVVTPVASFARYVMPEPMYFFGFWCALWIVLRALDRSEWLAATAGGVAFGLLSLVKPHAIALALALSIFLALRRLGFRSVAAAALQFGIFFLVHAGVGLLLTGHAVWSISAGSYGSTLVSHIDLLATLIKSVGHGAALLALLGPLVLVPVVIWWRDRATTAVGQFSMLTMCLLVAMVAMTVYFSQSVYQIAPDNEWITRLHGRYYVYALPLIALLGLHMLAGDGRDNLLDRRWAAACLLVSPVGGLVITIFYGAGPVDFPDLALWGGRYLLPASIGLIVAQIGVAIYGCFFATSRRLVTASLGFFVLAELATAFAFIIAVPLTLAPKPFDGAFLAPAKAPGLAALIGRSDGVVIGSAAKADDLARALFYLRGLSIGRFAPPTNQAVDADFPEGARWALILPGVDYRGASRVIAENGFSIVHLP
jgi:phosphoglycerol transferase